jgi:hypothetical protein
MRFFAGVSIVLLALFAEVTLAEETRIPYQVLALESSAPYAESLKKAEAYLKEKGIRGPLMVTAWEIGGSKALSKVKLTLATADSSSWGPNGAPRLIGWVSADLSYSADGFSQFQVIRTKFRSVIEE